MYLIVNQENESAIKVYEKFKFWDIDPANEGHSRGKL